MSHRRTAAPKTVARPLGGRSRYPAAGGGQEARAHEVRIVGGRWRRHRLPVLDAPGLRPTPDRVRETLFNWLGQDLAGWTVLDAFAGSGALGFEAASRGAADVRMLELDPRLVQSLKASRQRLGADTVTVTPSDAIAWMRRAPTTFDLVLLDPPFDGALFEAALDAALPCLAPGGWIYLEAPSEFAPEALAGRGLERWRYVRAGAVHAHLLRRAGE